MEREPRPIGYSFEVNDTVINCIPETPDNNTNTFLIVYQPDWSFMNYLLHQLPDGRLVKIYDCQDNIDDLFEYGWNIEQDIDVPDQEDIDDYMAYVHENIDLELQHFTNPN